MLTTAIERSAIDTPALWVDLDLMERNITYLGDFFRSAGVCWRPHTKGIKVPAIAHELLTAGAIGVTCAKLSEAEVMAAAGIRDILIANQVVGQQKAVRLANLQRHAEVKVAVDSVENATQLSRAATEIGAPIRVLIEVNVGLHRCGVEPQTPAVDFALKLAELPGIEVAGVMAWEGHVRRIADPSEKESRCREAVGSLVRTANIIRKAGLDISIVSCGGTGTHRITARVPGVTEIQAGGGVFGDLAYREWGVETACSLFVLATVVSRPTPTRAVVDAGFKTMDGSTAMPQPRDLHGAQLRVLDAEHGILELSDSAQWLRVGDKIDFIVGYGDSTIHLHDTLYGVRDERLEVKWEIQGRGKVT
jgi:D-serine deaminase-like pyridoxal phosphate-dependent protein